MLSWQEMRDRATRFARKWKGETREMGEYQTFWNEFFQVFGVERRSVALYQQAIERLGGGHGFIDLFWPGKLIAEHKSAGKSLDDAFDQAVGYAMALPEASRPRYIIACDYGHLRLYDLEAEGPVPTKMQEFPLAELPKRIREFAFIPGFEVRVYHEQDPVNRKAIREIVKLYAALAKSNYDRRNLERLLVRLVFCFFADDAGIFPPGEPFKYYLALGSHENGSDFGSRLDEVFSTLNTHEDRRQTTIDGRLAELPYVNGGLFADYLPVVFFDREMRRAVLDTSDFNWSAVSPAIFGSMFQFVTDEHDPNARHDLGEHYTSEKNIRKVIDGLFMDDLRAELEACGKNPQKLTELWEKVGHISLLDPACGCGNFLVVAYRELRRLELEILKRLHPQTRQIEGAAQTNLGLDIRHLSKLSIERMYGIEIGSFPAEIAKLSLWLADHLADKELGDYFGIPFVKLPLKEQAHIIEGNALTTDWEQVVPKEQLSYILGNPPFLGSRVMDDAQKKDMLAVFGKIRELGFLDYVTAWYKKAAEYIQGTHIEVGFVSTNSIAQGEQVGILWGELQTLHIRIHFAHRTFKWSNEAPGKAAVYCVIIGFAAFPSEHPHLFDYEDVRGEPHEVPAKEINPYLVPAPEGVIIRNRQKPLSAVPDMSFGSMPRDGGAFILSEEERVALLAKEPATEKFIRPYIGAQEFLHSEKRYCLWLEGAEPSEIRALPDVMRRVEAVKHFRLESVAASTRKMAETATLFAQRTQPKSDYILIPRVSSENRRYIPMGFFGASDIVADSCMAIGDASLYHFGVLESEMHMAWTRAVCGRLESRYRYSKDIVYNNFPWPEGVGEDKKAAVEAAAQKVLDARAAHPGATLADLYDPLSMPKDLLDAHHALDRATDAAYGAKGFKTEAERVAYLVREYERLAI